MLILSCVFVLYPRSVHFSSCCFSCSKLCAECVSVCVKMTNSCFTFWRNAFYCIRTHRQCKMPYRAQSTRFLSFSPFPSVFCSLTRWSCHRSFRMILPENLQFISRITVHFSTVTTHAVCYIRCN